jgi:glycerol uptake facilitator-like aquaporin
MKKYIAEFIGTFILSVSVIACLTSNASVLTGIIAGITLGLLVYIIGSISGAHVNPAVTLGAWSIKKINGQDVFFYILAQFAGAAIAIIASHLFGKVPTSLLTTSFSWGSLCAEMIGAAVFTFGIASVILRPQNQGHAPFAIGAALTVGATIAVGLGSNGVINPAVAFGIGSFGVSYIIGPVVGAVIGMWLFKLINTTSDSCTCIGTNCSVCVDGKNPAQCSSCENCKR